MAFNRFKKRGRRIKVSSKKDRTFDGIVFDSKWEMEVYKVLKEKIPADKLHLQPKFILQPGFRGDDGKAVRAISYSADFLIGSPRENSESPVPEGSLVVDAKGMHTDVYKIKKKMFQFKYGFSIHEIKNKKDIESILKRFSEVL